MPHHPAALSEEQLLAHCDVKRTRRSGPGGQHRNKVETAVVVTHRESGVVAEASERRSQEQNRAVAFFRLRVKLALEVRTSWNAAPSELWRSRCRGGRISVNPAHHDFPALLAEALDAVSHFEGDAKPAAERLGCSTSQLVRLLKLEPSALDRVNRLRLERGLHALK